MINIKRIFQTGLLATLLFFTATTSSEAQTISNHFFGENAWMPDTVGDANACTEPPCILYGKLHKNWDNIQNSGASIIRFGGIAADRNRPTNFQYIRMIDSIRAKGMEPVIQISFKNYRYTATQAAEIVRYLNVTKGKHIKYWIIGNEPDLGYSFTTAAQIANYIKPFASAMKSADPSILIIGPETAWYNQAIINGLTTPNGPDDITGKDAAGRFYIDIISFHTYPFDGKQTRDQVITKLTAPGSLQDNLASLNSRIAACNTAHGRTGASVLKTAITEANINWQNPANDDLQGVGANSFIGGQFIAEMLGIGMKNNVDFINLWSVAEGNTTANNIGFVDVNTGVKKPAYYHFQMISQNFKGTYINGISNQSKVKSFGSKSSSQTSVVIMNQDLSNNFNYTVRLNSAAIAGASALKININSEIASEYNDVVPAQSSVVLVFNSTGVLIKKIEYSLNQAIANQPPAVTNYTATGIEETASNNDNGALNINVFPNPTAGQLNISMAKSYSENKTFKVEIVNLSGQVVYNKDAEFKEGKETIDLKEGMANGVYVVRVKDGKKVTTKKVVLNTNS